MSGIVIPDIAASTYCTYADIDDEVTLTGIVPTDAVEQTWVETRILRAQGEIDGRLGKLYTVPFDPVPKLIHDLCMDISLYLILRKNYTGEDGNVSDWVMEHYNHADKLIKAIISGEIALDAPPSDSTYSNETAQISESDRVRELTVTTYDSSGNELTSGTAGYE
jgi:phage gp36-like protein